LANRGHLVKRLDLRAAAAAAVRGARNGRQRLRATASHRCDPGLDEIAEAVQRRG